MCSEKHVLEEIGRADKCVLFKVGLGAKNHTALGRREGSRQCVKSYSGFRKATPLPLRAGKKQTELIPCFLGLVISVTQEPPIVPQTWASDGVGGGGDGLLSNG